MYFDRHGLNTRSANSLNVVLPKPNVTLFKQSFKYAGAVSWHKLPNNIQNAILVDSIKHQYIYFFNRYNLFTAGSPYYYRIVCNT